MTLHASIAGVSTAGWRWPHLTPAELACRCAGRFCAGEYWHDPDLLDALQALRLELGRPLRVNSGRRCRLHNAAVGGAPLSMHTRAIAADVSVAGWDDAARRALLLGARRLGFTGLGYARAFLHLDRRLRPAEWDYQQGGTRRWKALLD
jgi:hypothetical protein